MGRLGRPSPHGPGCLPVRRHRRPEPRPGMGLGADKKQWGWRHPHCGVSIVPRQAMPKGKGSRLQQGLGQGRVLPQDDGLFLAGEGGL